MTRPLEIQRKTRGNIEDLMGTQGSYWELGGNCADSGRLKETVRETLGNLALPKSCVLNLSYSGGTQRDKSKMAIMALI